MTIKWNARRFWNWGMVDIYICYILFGGEGLDKIIDEEIKHKEDDWIWHTDTGELYG